MHNPVEWRGQRRMPTQYLKSGMTKISRKVEGGQEVFSILLQKKSGLNYIQTEVKEYLTGKSNLRGLLLSRIRGLRQRSFHIAINKTPIKRSHFIRYIFPIELKTLQDLSSEDKEKKFVDHFKKLQSCCHQGPQRVQALRCRENNIARSSILQTGLFPGRVPMEIEL